MNRAVEMSDLATFVTINIAQNTRIPKDLAEILKKSGWLTVGKNNIFVLPWKKILESNGMDVKELMERVEMVRLTLRRLRINYTITTMEANKTPT